MPSSNLVLAHAVVAMVAETHPQSVLDVGPGFGKYGVLIREYVRPTRLDAIEAEPRYVARFPWLEAIYDTVMVGDVTTDLSAVDLDSYDVVLLADVLEHVNHDAGAALLDRISGRAVICTPRDFFQNPEASEYPFECHRSVWTAQEIAAVRPLECEDVFASTIGGVLVRTAPR